MRNHPRVAFLAVAVVAGSAAGTAAQPAAPGIDDLLNLQRVGSPAVSPDGRAVAYTVRETNWDDNEYETEIWLGTAAGTRRLTHARKSSQQPAWSPDGAWVAFLSDRDGKRQLYRIAVAGGEAEKLTSGDEPVSAFAWSPDGRAIAITMTDPVADSVKERERRYGEIRFEDEDARMAHLYLVTIPESGAAAPPRALTKGAFVVGGFDWSPDGRFIAFDHRVSSDPADGASADISVVEVATGRMRAVVAQEGPDSNPRWAPDGRRIAFVSAMRKPFHYYANSVIAVVQLDTSALDSLTDTFDENPQLLAWTPQGIYFGASQRTWSYLFRIDPATRQVHKHAAADEWMASSFSLTPDGRHVAYTAATPTEFADVYLATVNVGASRGSTAGAGLGEVARISRTADQVAAWPKHAREVVRWKSQDGAAIEGVLHKPADFQAGRRYPLLVVIHGGPTGVSRPVPYSNGVGYYPIDLWLAKGALVLEPNYRGSAGYGEQFRSLNVRNLGIGDAWDVLSGIDHLVAAGLADGNRVGAMGWSQGGYISAFLTTKHSDRFQAVSVGAGISNWMTYYVNTDIHPFTRQYLKATPWDDPQIYADTSPMTYIKSANTPTLIQHGDQDQRVPVPNAFELYQGLRDQDVPARLVLFKGFGHPLNKPKANRAAMQQNLDWFETYLWPGPASTP